LLDGFFQSEWNGVITSRYASASSFVVVIVIVIVVVAAAAAFYPEMFWSIGIGRRRATPDFMDDVMAKAVGAPVSYEVPWYRTVPLRPFVQLVLLKLRDVDTYPLLQHCVTGKSIAMPRLVPREAEGWTTGVLHPKKRAGPLRLVQGLEYTGTTKAQDKDKGLH
jgi:hypothetical protein